MSKMGCAREQEILNVVVYICVNVASVAVDGNGTLLGTDFGIISAAIDLSHSISEGRVVPQSNRKGVSKGGSGGH